MTKSKKLADEITSILIASHPNIRVSEISDLIKQHFEQIHNEAVEATVMAENRPNFVKPKYQD